MTHAAEMLAAYPEDLGGIDRFVVNAGLGKGAPVGKGSHYANKETLTTNILGAFAQAEAALYQVAEGEGGGAQASGGESPTAAAQREEAEQSLGKGYG